LVERFFLLRIALSVASFCSLPTAHIHPSHLKRVYYLIIVCQAIRL